VSTGRRPSLSDRLRGGRPDRRSRRRNHRLGAAGSPASPTPLAVGALAVAVTLTLVVGALALPTRGPGAPGAAAAATATATVTATPPAGPSTTTTTTTTTPKTPKTPRTPKKTATAPPTPVAAYWLVASDGGIFAFGGARFYGSTGSMTLDKPVVGMAGTPDSKGYWLVAADGGIFTFGDAQFFGSTGAMHLDAPVVAMAPTPDGKGYWLVAADGGIFCFGDAQFYGSMGGKPLNQPIVGMTATPDGGGYWLVAADGGIFAFGDARFYGSTGSLTLNAPIVSMASTPDGLGYILVASDGGVFAYGDARFHGSLGGVPLSRPVVAMAMTPHNTGYWFTDDNGAVSNFGKAGYFGSAPQVLNEPVVGMTEAAGTGDFSGSSYQSGSYGYDVAYPQCSQPLPTPPYAIAVVEVDGNGKTTTVANPCLAKEAAWAGGALNLYDFLVYGTAATGPGACQGDQACNFGFAQAEATFEMAKAAGVDTSVTWWLDVEGTGWSTNVAENAQVVEGDLLGYRAEGINNVGIYASPGTWNTIVGDYQPDVPYWMAWYSEQGGPYNCTNTGQWEKQDQLPSGPVVMTQFASPTYPYPSDGLTTAVDNDYAC
jgi:hypothetical protein